MSDNLNDLVGRTINANSRLLTRSNQKVRNQEIKESHLKRKLKRGLVYSAIVSVLALGAYGGNVGLHKYNDYITQQKKKVVHYQNKFDKVKYYYNKRDYFKADELSEKLQEEMDKEWFFSPASDLYKKVKEYDNNIIDPEIKRIKREKFYRNLKDMPHKVFSKLEDKWDDTTPGQKAVVYIGGSLLLIYLLRRRS